MKRDSLDNWMPLATLMLITVLNVGIVISLLIAQVGGSRFGLNSIQVYVLVGLELAVVISAYVIGKRRTPTAYF
jgi:hypothetical protein